jgi:hypothetical protein
MTTNDKRWRRPRAAAFLAVAMLAACGGESDEFAPTAPFQLVVPSLPLVVAPRVAASPDGSTTWLAWVEGDNATQSVVAGKINSVAVIRTQPVASHIAGALRDPRITMVGVTPVVTWRGYAPPNGVKANAASYVNGDWRMEISASASALGDIVPTLLPSGEISLSWTRIDAAGNFQLVAARRFMNGAWSIPAVIRSGAAATTLLRSSQAADAGGALQLLWSEAAGGGGAPPPAQALFASRWNPVLATWTAPVVVDSGQRYDAPAVAATGGDTWLATWLSGDASATSSLLAKRFAGGAWEAAATRVDRGQDDALSELALAAGGGRVTAGWIGRADDLSSGSVRASAFDAATATWSAPATVGAAAAGFPIALRLQSDGLGTSAAVWNVAQGGEGGPFLNTAEPSGAWQSAAALDPQTTGLAPDVAFFAANDIATSWYRLAPGGRAEIVVRRLR